MIIIFILYKYSFRGVILSNHVLIIRRDCARMDGERRSSTYCNRASRRRRQFRRCVLGQTPDRPIHPGRLLDGRAQLRLPPPRVAPRGAGVPVVFWTGAPGTQTQAPTNRGAISMHAERKVCVRTSRVSSCANGGAAPSPTDRRCLFHSPTIFINYFLQLAFLQCNCARPNFGKTRH
jgi:hypothetical protein